MYCGYVGKTKLVWALLFFCVVFSGVLLLISLYYRRFLIVRIVFYYHLKLNKAEKEVFSIPIYFIV